MLKKKTKELLLFWIVFFLSGLILLTWGLIIYCNTAAYSAASTTVVREYVDINSTYIRSFYLLNDDKVTIEIINDNDESNNLSISWFDKNNNVISNQKEFTPLNEGEYKVKIQNVHNYPIEFNIEAKSKYVENYYKNSFNTSYLVILSGIILIGLAFTHMAYFIWKK